MLKIIRAGMYTTVQDGGRHGFRQSGISHCGALDMPALRIANLLVGNDANAPADAPRDKCTLSCAINGIHAAFHYLKKNYISGCVMTVPTG